MADTPADRVREIRKSLGTGMYPLSQAKLAKLMRELSGRAYIATMVTKMESGERRVTDRDARWLAMLDPEHRGIGWVLCWPEAQTPATGEVTGVVLNEANHRVLPEPPPATVAAPRPRRGRAAGEK